MCCSYIAQVAPAAYPKVLRNLIWGALAINLPILLITYAVLPSKDILSGSNILSLVGERAAGTWLRKIIVVDSAIVVSRSASETSYTQIDDCS
jgi:hypothetical protein